MLSNVECRVTCKFTVRNRGREREQNSEFELSGYYIFCVRIPTNEMGRKNIYVKREREIRKKKKTRHSQLNLKMNFYKSKSAHAVISARQYSFPSVLNTRSVNSPCAISQEAALSYQTKKKKRF